MKPIERIDENHVRLNVRVDLPSGETFYSGDVADVRKYPGLLKLEKLQQPSRVRKPKDKMLDDSDIVMKDAGDGGRDE